MRVTGGTESVMKLMEPTGTGYEDVNHPAGSRGSGSVRGTKPTKGKDLTKSHFRGDACLNK